MSEQGCFITLEGGEGAGKTTLVSFLKEYLESKGHEVVTVREPGGTALAEKIRAILVTPDKEKLCDRAELLLMYAARAQLVESLIKPALKAGKIVISDRHDLSTLAYQGGGRGLPIEDIKALRKLAIGDFKPDLTLLMDIDPVLGLQRIKTRGALDRFEQEQLNFFTRVRETYLQCAREEQGIIVIDASQDLEAVQQAAAKAADEVTGDLRMAQRRV